MSMFWQVLRSLGTSLDRLIKWRVETSDATRPKSGEVPSRTRHGNRNAG